MLLFGNGFIYFGVGRNLYDQHPDPWISTIRSSLTFSELIARVFRSALTSLVAAVPVKMVVDLTCAYGRRARSGRGRSKVKRHARPGSPRTEWFLRSETVPAFGLNFGMTVPTRSCEGWLAGSGRWRSCVKLQPGTGGQRGEFKGVRNKYQMD